MSKIRIRNSIFKFKGKLLKNKDISKYRNISLSSQNELDPITMEMINKPTLDHDHSTGRVRLCLQNETNQFLGRVESFYKRYIKYKNLNISLPEILRNMANYLEKDYNTSPIHPKSVQDLIRKFKNLNLKEQELFFRKEKIKDYPKSKKDRTKLFKKIITDKNNILKF